MWKIKIICNLIRNIHKLYMINTKKIIVHACRFAITNCSHHNIFSTLTDERFHHVIFSSRMVVRVEFYVQLVADGEFVF